MSINSQMATPRVAVVTGGGSGIGLATTQLLTDAGYSVVIVGRDEAKLQAAASSFGASGAVTYVCADLSSSAAAATVISAVQDRHGRLDLLVNSHGVLGAMKPLEDLTDGDLNEALAINLVGPVVATIAAAPLLKESKGSVVNVISINALQAEPDAVPYGISKTGLMGFTRYAAVEMAPHGVRVNAVLPGWVKTPMTEEVFESEEYAGKPLTCNLMRRPAEPEEVASVIAFLGGTGASFMTGACIVADGGQVMALTPLGVANDQ